MMNLNRLRRRRLLPDVERTAQVLLERLGDGAFDHAARQVAILHLTDRESSADEWRRIAREIERLSGVSH